MSGLDLKLDVPSLSPASPAPASPSLQQLNQAFKAQTKGFPRPLIKAIVAALVQSPSQHVLLDMSAFAGVQLTADHFNLLAQGVNTVTGLTCDFVLCNQRTQPSELYQETSRSLASGPTVSLPAHVPSSALWLPTQQPQTRGDRADRGRFAGDHMSSLPSSPSNRGAKPFVFETKETHESKKDVSHASSQDVPAAQSAGAQAASRSVSVTIESTFASPTDAAAGSLHVDGIGAGFQYSNSSASTPAAPPTLVSMTSGSAGHSGAAAKAAHSGRRGPVFCNVLIVHNVDLAPAHTQAVLLQAMRLRNISIEGTLEKLPDTYGLCVSFGCVLTLRMGSCHLHAYAWAARQSHSTESRTL